MSRWPVIKAKLFAPSLQEVCDVLQRGLLEEFNDVSVSVRDCPDLTSKPYMLASKGICGSPRVLDIGGVPYLVPTPCMDKIYDLKEVPSWCELASSSTLMIGAGAAPSHVVGKLAELMTNIAIDATGSVRNLTKLCRIDDKTGRYQLESLPKSCECKHISNLFVSEGQPGKVIEVKASRKQSSKGNFVVCMQNALKHQYGSNAVGIGGVFVMSNGKARIHVMPCYSEVPLQSNEMVDEWLRFYEMSAPLTCIGYLMSHDPGLNLRMEHFHCFSEHGDGGHFHHDVTPDDVEYTGYFNVADYLFRVDQST